VLSEIQIIGEIGQCWEFRAAFIQEVAVEVSEYDDRFTVSQSCDDVWFKDILKHVQWAIRPTIGHAYNHRFQLFLLDVKP